MIQSELGRFFAAKAVDAKLGSRISGQLFFRPFEQDINRIKGYKRQNSMFCKPVSGAFA